MLPLQLRLYDKQLLHILLYSDIGWYRLMPLFKLWSSSNNNIFFIFSPFSFFYLLKRTFPSFTLSMKSFSDNRAFGFSFLAFFHSIFLIRSSYSLLLSKYETELILRLLLCTKSGYEASTKKRYLKRKRQVLLLLDLDKDSSSWSTLRSFYFSISHLFLLLKVLSHIEQDVPHRLHRSDNFPALQSMSFHDYWYLVHLHEIIGNRLPKNKRDRYKPSSLSLV